jgi:hypothetical protein
LVVSLRSGRQHKAWGGAEDVHGGAHPRQSAAEMVGIGEQTGDLDCMIGKIAGWMSQSAT